MQPKLPQLTIQQLEYLAAVSNQETWAKAAKHLQVTPSALSQGLAELERRLGIPLFERMGRRRVLTNNANEVVRYAQNVLAQTTDLARWANELNAGQTGTLRIGMIDVAAVAHFPRTLQAFIAQHPDLDLSLTVASSAQLVEAVLAGELAFALVVKPPKTIVDCHLTEVLAEDLAIYAPDGTIQGDPATWGPWVLFPEVSHTRQLVAQALQTRGAPVQVTAVSNQPDVLREMVQLGMGWTVLPVVQAEQGPNPLQRAQPQPLIQRHLVIAQREDALPNPAADNLIGALLRASPHSLHEA